MTEFISDIDGTKDYVKAVWKNFMGTNISDEELQSLTDSVITFKTQYPNQTLSDAFLFLKSNGDLTASVLSLDAMYTLSLPNFLTIAR